MAGIWKQLQGYAVVPQKYHAVSSAASKSHHKIHFRMGPRFSRSKYQGLGHMLAFDVIHTYCHNPLARFLCLSCTHRHGLPHGKVQLFQFGILHVPPLQTCFSVSLTGMMHSSFQETSHTQKAEQTARSPQKTRWEPPSASRIYLSNVFSTYCLCFSMKIQLSCQTCITNDSICLYKKSGILCNGTVFKPNICQVSRLFFNYNLFQWKQKT